MKISDYIYARYSSESASEYEEWQPTAIEMQHARERMSKATDFAAWPETTWERIMHVMKATMRICLVTLFQHLYDLFWKYISDGKHIVTFEVRLMNSEIQPGDF